MKFKCYNKDKCIWGEGIVENQGKNGAATTCVIFRCACLRSQTVDEDLWPDSTQTGGFSKRSHFVS